MAEIKYPAALTKKAWTKAKPVLANTKKTGIGEKLDDLQKLHDKIQWTNYQPNASIASIDDALKLWPATFKKELKPLAKLAAEAQTLAEDWAAKFKKDKLMPKAAEKAASDVATAAKSYAAEVLDFEGAHAKNLVNERKKIVDATRKVLKPMWTKTSKKIDALLKDIRAYANNPTEENYWSLFSGDSNARGYVTGCKNWDQLMIEFPEIRDQCYKGKAMTDFFPGMGDFGANYATAEFEQRVNAKTGKTGSQCYIEHAKRMIKEVPNIKKFQTAVDKCLTLLA
jgi:Skp family chaperone for outer membrane proteins